MTEPPIPEQQPPIEPGAEPPTEPAIAPPPRPRLRERLAGFWQRYRLPLLLFAAALALALLAGLIWLLRDLPSLAELDDLQPKVPLRVYSRDKVLIGEFGKERRSLVKLADIPADLKQAVLAIEDARFYDHGAIDVVGVLRAGFANLGSGGRGQGASTITMQVARDLFLTRDKTVTRKLREIVVAYKIEAVRSKDEILELYMNQIYLGQRAYGFASAARVYFGKELGALTLAESAMLAGLPKAPSAYNPVSNPRRARVRQEYILKRMRELGYIDEARYRQALAEPLQLARGQNATPASQPHAEYAAEMVRQAMFDKYGEAAYSRGLTVVTTIDYAQQQMAWESVRQSLLDYDRRRGWRGPEAYVALPEPAAREDSADELLAAHPDADGQVAAVVVAASPRKVVALTRDGDTVEIAEPGLRFAAAGLREGAPAKLRIRPGAIVRIGTDARGVREIVQLPQIQGALVALAPQDGAIRALVGGFDFGVNKFNRAAQAWRQPGSTFKPFVYSAALERGVGPATIVNDAAFPVQLDPGSDKRWEPKNDDGSEAGPISMRSGLQKSKNLVAVRVANHVGVPFIRDYVQRFGFVPAQVPPYLPMALGAGQVTPLQLAGAYAMFANGGWRVPPYLIAEVRDGRGQLLLQARPAVAEANAIRALTPRNAFVMHQLLLGVAQRGTAWQSNALGRSDIGGKTGTTNDMHDVWFAGYQHSLLAVSWLGYDQPRSVGAGGAQLALPMWMRFMGRALKGVPVYQMPQPPGVLQIGGEWYLDLFTPGNGFVSAIGMDGVEMPPPDELVDEDMSGTGPDEGEAEEGDSTYVEPPAEEQAPPMDEATPPPSAP